MAFSDSADVNRRIVSVIENPQISMVLTGTFSQYKALVPSIENGYFSRLITLIVDEHQAFNSSYVQPSENSGESYSPETEEIEVPSQGTSP